jgi:hypothetical protein
MTPHYTKETFRGLGLARDRIEEIAAVLHQLEQPDADGFTLPGTERNGYRATACIFVGDYDPRTGQSKEAWLEEQRQNWRQQLERWLAWIRRFGINAVDSRDALELIETALSRERLFRTT